MNTLYTLTVKKGSQTAIYSQGISPVFIRFDGITFFQIDKIVWNHWGSESTPLTRPFIGFQRLLRKRLALIRGAIDEARNFLKPLLDSSPDNTIFRFERARIATAAGNEQQALVDLSFVIDNAANAMSSMFIIGAGATAMGADIRASPFDEVLSIPEIRRARLESLIMRSKIRLSLGMREPAVADLDAAVLAAPDRNDIRALRDLLRQ